MSDKVTVVSTVASIVEINLPYQHFRKEWNKKGAKVLIDKEFLAEALYDAGVEYMFKNGILYIENMQDKIDLGLEPEGSQEPENIIVLTDAEKKRLMTTGQGWELKGALEKLSYNSRLDFCNYVVENELLDGAKAKIIKEICDFDIIRAIENRRSNAGE